MRIFTKIEIDLCKKIAEKDFKEITYGDYYSHGDDIGYLCDGRKLKHALDTIDVVPLWQEHDCLEWLRGKGFEWIDIRIHFPDTAVVVWGREPRELDKMSEFSSGYSILEALLRAILFLMKDKK